MRFIEAIGVLAAAGVVATLQAQQAKTSTAASFATTAAQAQIAVSRGDSLETRLGASGLAVVSPR